MNNILTGAAMGAALTTAGVYAPDVILAQFNFTDFTMLQTFLSAAAGSTLLVTIAQTLHLTTLPPRTPSTLTLFTTPTTGSTTTPTGFLPLYSGNILGGALLGTGMAVSGACPGTVLAQLGVGVASGRYALAGAVLGGVVWAGVVRGKGKGRGEGGCSGGGAVNGGDKRGIVTGGNGGKGAAEGKGKGDGKRTRSDTVYEALGVSRGVLLVGLEAVLVAAIAASVKYTAASAGEQRGIPPYLAGLAIAAAQLVSMVLRGSLLGASTAFEELGGWVWGSRKYANLLFSAGMVGGAWLISQAVPALRPVTDVAISPIKSVVGGFMIVFGSRIAGGCTSGHGISGLSLMSISSFLTAAAIFGAGGLTGLLMG